MNVGLGWFGVGVGAVGCIATYLMAGGTTSSPTGEDAARDRRIAWLCAVATVIVALAFWAIGMRQREPFSTGQGLALGFLIGGLAGAVAILLTFRLSGISAAVGSPRSTRLGTLSSLFFGLFAVALTYSLFSSDPSTPLIGFAIGAVMAGIFHTYAQYTKWGELSVRTELWAVFAVTVAAAIIMAVEHFDATQFRMWWPLPILMATTTLIAAYIGVEIGAMLSSAKPPEEAPCLSSILVAAVLLAGSTAIYAGKLYNSWELLYVTTAGLGAAALAAWLLAGLGQEDDSPGSVEAGAATVILIVAFTVVAFKLWSGLGIAVGLIAAWAVAIPALGARSSADARSHFIAGAASLPLVAGLVIVLFRLYLQFYRPDLRGTDLGIHYTFVGAMLGAVLPLVFLTGLTRLRGASPGEGPREAGAIAAIAVTGLVAAASPLALVVLWGLTCALGYAFGLTAAVVFILLSRLSYGDIRYPAGLLIIAAQLTALPFARLLADLELARTARIIVLAAIVVLVVIWLGVSSAFAARRAR